MGSITLTSQDSAATGIAAITIAQHDESAARADSASRRDAPAPS
jgi:hypothetical protein